MREIAFERRPTEFDNWGWDDETLPPYTITFMYECRPVKLDWRRAVHVVMLRMKKPNEKAVAKSFKFAFDVVTQSKQDFRPIVQQAFNDAMDYCDKVLSAL